MATSKAKAPVVEWTVREQLILASAVQRSGDQNWVSVSRAVKPLVEDARPPDYFSQKNCALQYSSMLDKAKHPKRKRSSDGALESAVTLEEQIVRQLTEKRMKELNSSMNETRKEYYALKKEIEQIENGELDSELAGMWEKVREELAVKESTESKGSRSRRSSVNTPTGSSSESENTKKTKVAATTPGGGGGGASATGEKKTHKSPEKRASSSTASSSHTPTSTTTTTTPAETINVSGSLIKEERVVDVVESTTTSLDTPTIPPSPATTTTASTISTHSSPIATQTTPRSAASKKRNLENLTLNVSAVSASSTDIFLHDESPLPCPMTVPKEEQLRESIAASGGRLSRSLLHPLSPDMHIIVQQPNIAAITTDNKNDSIPTTSTTTNGTQSINVGAGATDKPAEKLQGSTALSSLEIKTGASQLKSSSKIEGNDPVPTAFNKQELLQVSAPTGPKTVAEALSSTIRLKLSPPVVSKQFTSLPSTMPVERVTETQASRISSKMTSSSTDKTLPPSTTSATVSSSIHLPTYSVPTYTAPTNTLPSQHPSTSTATTVVSSKLSDPRLSSAAFRPTKTSASPHQQQQQQQQQQTTLLQYVQTTTGDKNKSQVTKIKLDVQEVDEKKKKKKSEERSQAPKQKEQDTTKDAKPGGIRKLMLSSHTATSTASDQHAINPLPTAGEKTQVSKTKEPQHVLPLQRPPLSASSSSSSSSTKPAINDNNDSGQSQKSKVEVGMSGEVEQSTVMVSMSGTTQEKSAIVERSSANFTSSQLDDSAVNSDNVKDELREEQIEETQNTSSETLMDEQAQMEAGSSRRSSISELPSSPLTGGGGGKDETDPEETISRRKPTKTALSKLWPTRRKRKVDLEEGMSVESTDFDSEEEPSSRLTSAAASPAPSQGDGDQDGGMSKKQWKKAIMLVWRHAAQHKYANLFLHPVRDDDAPGYRDVIHRPMDLSSIKRNIETGVTTTDTEFQRDMLLMFQNAFMYNSSDHDVYDMAEKMRADVMQSIQDYLSTQLQLIVESSTPKVLRSRDKEGRRSDVHDDGLLTPVKKRRTRADDV